ncbi:hypothetical protein QBC38DRAFT_172171 [Podospora fimiseda]|uniref:Uncharacterized protein n=1 Tax=Podospora fimiseda TaxID=252190 RepID=A0AAN7BE70_9PEZI|nr:hypothetical protein QBC38DRAFT_172171 [Podospora fimiseda]
MPCYWGGDVEYDGVHWYRNGDCSISPRYSSVSSNKLFDLGVDITTGALCTNMFRLVTMGLKPTLVTTIYSDAEENDIEYYIFLIQAGERHQLHVCCEACLDLYTKPGDALYLFLASSQRQWSAGYILRPSPPPPSASSVPNQYYQLVAHCSMVQLAIPEEILKPTSNWFARNGHISKRKENWISPIMVGTFRALCEDPQCWHYNLEALHVGQDLWRDWGATRHLMPRWKEETEMGDLRRTLYEVIERVRSWLESELTPFEKLIFAHHNPGTQHSKMLQVYDEMQSIEQPSNTCRFLDAYRKHISPEGQPQFHWPDYLAIKRGWKAGCQSKLPHINDLLIVLSVSLADLFAVIPHIPGGKYSDVVYWNGKSHKSEHCHMIGGCKTGLEDATKWTVVNEDKLDMIYYEKGPELTNIGAGRWKSGDLGTFHYRDDIKVQIPMEYIVQYFRFGPGVRAPYMLKRAAEITGQSEADLISREPTEADHLVSIPTGSIAERLIKEGGFDGWFERVAIL